MEEIPSASQDNSLIRSALHFLGHQIFGIFGSQIIAGMISAIALMALSSLALSASGLKILTATPYFPVQTLVALLLGWAFYCVLEHRSMLWVWTIPVVLLCYLVITDFTFPVHGRGFMPRSDQTVWTRYFGSGCAPIGRCEEQLAFTLYFYSAAFYSLGAFLARKTSKMVVHSLQCSGILIVGLLVLSPLIETVISLGGLAIFNFTMFKEVLNVLKEPYQATQFGWWIPVLAALLTLFPIAIGGFLIRSAVKMRRQVAHTQPLLEL